VCVGGAKVIDRRPQIYATTLGGEKLEDGPIRPRKNFDDTFSRFDTNHTCDRQTYGRTDGETELA